VVVVVIVLDLVFCSKNQIEDDYDDEVEKEGRCGNISPRNCRGVPRNEPN